jgi:hypothetical protein
MKTIEQKLFELTGMLKIDSWEKYYNALRYIEKHYKEHETTADSVPSAPNTSTFRATRSGFIKIRENYTHRGGYYGFDRSLPYALVVGSRVRSDISEEIKELVEEASNEAKEHITINGNKPFFHESHGTNFSTFGLAV